MSELAIYARIGEAIDRHRDAVLALQELSEEFADAVSRLRSMSDRLEKNLKPGLDTPGVIRLPNVLRGGPRRPEGVDWPADVEPSQATEGA